MHAIVTTALGRFLVDLDDEEVVDDEEPERPCEEEAVEISLPRLVAAARRGSTVVAVVDRRPPLLVSHDAGLTWRESGAGLPPGRAVAIAPEDPDVIVFAGAERLYLSRDGARFWHALAVELPEITAVALVDAD